MVSATSFIAMSFTLLLCFGIPITLFILLKRRSKNVTGAFVAGLLAFYISQMLIRIPVIQLLLPKFKWFNELGNNIFLYILFFAVTAALFEETARYLIFQLLLKENLTWKAGLAYGIGHGGMEAIVIVGFTYINNIIYSIMINNNALDSFLAGKVDSTMVQNIEKALTQTSPGLFMAAGIERAITILIQIALSILILEGIIRNRKLFFYFIALAAHTFINMISSYLAYLKINFWLIELTIAIFAIAGVIYVINSKKRFSGSIEKEDAAAQALKEGY